MSQPWKHREVIGDCTLYLGDCLEVMPTLGKVDAVVTDPPYGIDYGRAGGFSASHGWSNNREKVEWDVARPKKEAFDLMLSISNQQVIWGGNYFTDYLAPSMQWLIWDKVQRGFSLADCEMAWTGKHKASRVFSYARGNESGFAPRGCDWPNAHPTQKPIGVMKWCLGFTGGLVLDPFVGSGSTLVACVATGRAGIGIELDPDYFEIACERVRKAYASPDMFIEAEKAKPEIQDALQFGEVAV